MMNGILLKFWTLKCLVLQTMVLLVDLEGVTKWGAADITAAILCKRLSYNNNVIRCYVMVNQILASQMLIW